MRNFELESSLSDTIITNILYDVTKTTNFVIFRNLKHQSFSTNHAFAPKEKLANFKSEYNLPRKAISFGLFNMCCRVMLFIYMSNGSVGGLRAIWSTVIVYKQSHDLCFESLNDLKATFSAKFF